MIKRTICLLLALFMCLGLFTACAGEPAAPMQPEPEKESPAPGPAEDPIPEPQSPAVGEEPGVKYSRLREEAIYALEPGNDYGVIYPFAGGISRREGEEEGYIYGLFDQQGRIVCDPVYTEVEPLAYYVKGQKHTVPMLCLAVTEGEDRLCTLASADGSFVSPESYRLVRAMDFGVFCAENYDSAGFKVYDFEGNVLMTEAELKLGELSLGSAGDIFEGRGGYLLAWLRHEGLTRAYLIDPEGAVVDGGWYSADFTADGNLLVMGSEGGNSSGVLGLDGEWIIEPKYDSISSFGRGYVCERGNQSHVYGLGGEPLAAYTGEVRAAGRGYVAEGKFHTADGKSLPFGEGWNTGDFFGLSPIIYKWDESGLSLVNVNNPGAPMFLPGIAGGSVDQLSHNFFAGPYSELEYITVWSGDMEQSPVLVSWDLQRVYSEFEDIAKGPGAFEALRDGYTGEEYIRVNNESGKAEIYTYEMDLVAAAGEWTGIWNGLLCKTDGSFCCYYDVEGELFFGYPLAVGAGD